jgi:hypothetical protein
VNYRTLSNEELLKLWLGNRNAMSAVMAADEIMNRLDRGEYVMVDADEYEQLKESAKENE